MDCPAKCTNSFTKLKHLFLSNELSDQDIFQAESDASLKETV